MGRTATPYESRPLSAGNHHPWSPKEDEALCAIYVEYADKSVKQFLAAMEDRTSGVRDPGVYYVRLRMKHIGKSSVEGVKLTPQRPVREALHGTDQVEEGELQAKARRRARG